MFRFTQEPSLGSYNQCLAKITSLAQLCMSIQTLSVLRRHMPAYVGTEVVSVMEAYAMSLMMVAALTETCWSGCYKFNWFFNNLTILYNWVH